jgi:hypothetical protein
MRSQLVPCLALMGVLTLLSVPVIFYGLGSYGLVNGDEGVYHAISRNMLESGNWFRLEFTGEHRVYDTFMNSPLQYWLRGNVIRVLGDNYWSMRISSAVFAWLSVLALFTLVWWMATPRAAFLAALAQLTSFQFIYQHGARTGELEPIVCFLLTAAALTFLRGIFESRSFALHILCVGLLANVKTPLVLLPLLADLAFFAVASEHRSHLRRWLVACLFLPLAFVWHLAQFLWLGEEASHAFRTMLGKMASSGAAAKAKGLASPSYYAWVTFFGAFPFSVAYPFAIAHNLRRPRWAEDESRKLLLLLLYAAAVYLFFCFLRARYPWYVVPAIPFLSALLGVWLDRLGTDRGVVISVVVPALLVSLLLCLEAATYNPFSFQGWHPRWGGIAWREFGPASAAWICPILVFASGGVALWARSRLETRYPLLLLSVLCTLLFAPAFVRVLRPLQFLDTQSEVETLQRELHQQLSSGQPLRYPIEIRELGPLKVRYFFGDDFRITKARGRPGVHFLLTGPGQTPRISGQRPRPASRSNRP